MVSLSGFVLMCDVSSPPHLPHVSRSFLTVTSPPADPGPAPEADPEPGAPAGAGVDADPAPPEPRMVVTSPCMKAQGGLLGVLSSGQRSPLGQYTSPSTRRLWMYTRVHGKQNLCPCTDGHCTKCVSSNLSWHKVQDSVFPAAWLLLADAEPSSEAPLWGKAGAVVAASADVPEPSGSPPERAARGRGCRAGDEAGLGLVWLTPPAITEAVRGRPVLLLPLLPATAEWT